MSADREILSVLHEAVAEDLLAKIRSGEAKSSDLAVAVKFLKDNGIDAVASNGNPLANLLDQMPFAEELIKQ